MDYLALKTEIQADPMALGYAPYVAAGNDIAIADLLNALTGPGAAAISRQSITRGAFIDGIIPGTDQLSSGVSTSNTPFTQAQKDRWTFRFNGLGSGDPVIKLDARKMGMLNQIVNEGIMTQAQIDAFTKRTGSRAEVLWGEGVTITANDVARAVRLDNGARSW